MCGGSLHTELITLRFIEEAHWKKDYRLTIRFDDGVTKTVNLCDDIVCHDRRNLSDLDYFKSFSIDPHKGSLFWPNGERYVAQQLYELGIRCKMDFDEPAAEWYLSCFDDHLDGAEVLYATSFVPENCIYREPLFILFSKDDRLYYVLDEIIDGCDPACGAGWEEIRQETSTEKLFQALDHDGLGMSDGKDIFSSELRTFLEQYEIDHVAAYRCLK